MTNIYRRKGRSPKILLVLQGPNEKLFVRESFGDGQQIKNMLTRCNELKQDVVQLRQDVHISSL